MNRRTQIDHGHRIDLNEFIELNKINTDDENTVAADDIESSIFEL